MSAPPRRLVSAEKRVEDDVALRPQVLADFTGQEAVRKNLKVFIESAKTRGEVAGLGDHGARGGAETDAEFARHDLRQRGLAEARRADEQHMIERVAARFGGLDEDAEIFARRFLAGEVDEALRADRRLVLGTFFGRDEAARRFGHFRRLRPGDEGDPPRSIPVAW